MTSPTAFVCPCCGKQVNELPACTFKSPEYYFQIPENERPDNTWLTSDFCVVGDFRYIRTNLHVPIRGSDIPFVWGIWSSLSIENFNRYEAQFNQSEQSMLGAMFSWLSSALIGYPSTIGIPTRIVPQDGRLRPLVYVDEDHDHPLVVDIATGISPERAIELAMPFLPKH